jgi:hypothetical protein
VETTSPTLKFSKTYTIAVNVGQPVYNAIGLSAWLPEEPTNELVSVLREKTLEIINK